MFRPWDFRNLIPPRWTRAVAASQDRRPRGFRGGPGSRDLIAEPLTRLGRLNPRRSSNSAPFGLPNDLIAAWRL